jgi:hypothetical protein
MRVETDREAVSVTLCVAKRWSGPEKGDSTEMEKEERGRKGVQIRFLVQVYAASNGICTLDAIWKV